MRTQNDTYFVIGCKEQKAYMHWKGDGISGTYCDTADPEDAEQFDTAKEARHFMETDEDAKYWVKSHADMGPKVLRVTKRVYVV